MEEIWKYMIFYTLPSSVASETELILTCVVPIAELGQKFPEAATTFKYEPSNSCIAVHSVWIMKIFYVMLPNTYTRNKRRKNCEGSRWRSQSALVRPLPMPCLNRCQDLIGSYASTHSTFNLIGSCNKHPNIQSHKATKIHALTPLTYELFFLNSSKNEFAFFQT